MKNGSNPDLWTQSTDGLNSSRLGFRGVEDLGGGLSAGFWLEAGLAADAGNLGGSNGLTAPVNGSSNIFNRRSTVSLIGPWGEIRFGRDYTPGFWNTTIFDPFGTNGVGAFTNLSIAYNIATFVNLPSANVSYVRANNSFGYFLPSNLGGLYGQLQHSLQEQGAPNGNKQTQRTRRLRGRPVQRGAVVPEDGVQRDRLGAHQPRRFMEFRVHEPDGPVRHDRGGSR